MKLFKKVMIVGMVVFSIGSSAFGDDCSSRNSAAVDSHKKVSDQGSQQKGDKGTTSGSASGEKKN